MTIIGGEKGHLMTFDMYYDTLVWYTLGLN